MRRYFPPVLVLLSLVGCEWSALSWKASTGAWLSSAEHPPVTIHLLVAPANAQESSPSGKIRNLEIESLPTLRVGDEAPEVAKLQTNLQKLGYYQGEISNTFTPATQQALVQFQQDSNLTSDGVAGPNTWKTLFVTAATESDTASDPETAANQTEASSSNEGQGEGEASEQEEASDSSSTDGENTQSNGGWRGRFSRIALLVFGGIFGIGAFAGLFAILLKLSGSEEDQLETPPASSGKSGKSDVDATPSDQSANPFPTQTPETSPSPAAAPTQTEAPPSQPAAAPAYEPESGSSSSETEVVSASSSLEAAPETSQTNGKSGGERHTASESPAETNPRESESSLSQPNQPSQLAKINIVEELIKELQAPDPVKRRKAIWELGQQGDSRAVYPLLNLMLESDSKQQGLILAALAEIGTRITSPLNQALVMALQADKPEVRKNAIRDLMRVYDSFAEVSHLLSHAHHDPDPQVQETAQWAIAKLHRLRAIAQGDIPKTSRRFPSDEISLPSPVQQVVNIMLFRGEVTLEEAAESTGYERDTVEKMLEPLVKQKVIARYEGEEGIFYRINQVPESPEFSKQG